MYSITFGEVSFDSMINIIRKYIDEEKHHEYRITIGTDSQNTDTTKIVSVVAIWRVGHGGIFFYDVKRVRKITNINQKIFYETSLSLEMAEKLSIQLNTIYKECEISIHVDAGNNGPSSTIINEITAWVNSCGYQCKTKPYSYAASSIANRYSK